MKWYLTLNGKSFKGHENSKTRRGYVTRKDALKARAEMQEAYPYTGSRKNVWGVGFGII